jgi:hypothetical protein
MQGKAPAGEAGALKGRNGGLGASGGAFRPTTAHALARTYQRQSLFQ